MQDHRASLLPGSGAWTARRSLGPLALLISDGWLTVTVLAGPEVVLGHTWHFLEAQVIFFVCVCVMDSELSQKDIILLNFAQS